MTSHEVRIRISWGLVGLAVLQAIVICAVMIFGHVTSTPEPVDNSWKVPSSQPRVDESVRSYAPLEQPPDVNLEAQNEMKQAGGCVPCGQPQYSHSRLSPNRPAYINGERVVAWGPSRVVRPEQSRVTERPLAKPEPRPTAKPRPKPKPRPASEPEPKPESRQFIIPADPGETMPAVRNVSNRDGDRPGNKQFQLILFLDSSAQSQQVIQWFRDDPTLAKARVASDFQYYRPDNPLYKSRFADIVPVSQFPVVLFQDADGGHIHAAGGNMIPSTPAELWDDMREGYRLYEEAKQGNMRTTGAIRTRGYSWDATINPSLQLADADCPDGNCPLPDNEPSWRPFDRVRPDRDGGGLFDGGSKPKSLLMWANGQELMTVGVMAIGALLVLFIMFKHRS